MYANLILSELVFSLLWSLTACGSFWRSGQPTPCECLRKCGPHLPPYGPPPPPSGMGFPQPPHGMGMPFPPPPPPNFGREFGGGHLPPWMYPGGGIANGPRPVMPPFLGGGPMEAGPHNSNWLGGMGQLRNPLVLPLIHGNFSARGNKLTMHPSVVLVIDEKSTGNERRFILVDTGLSLYKHTVISALLAHGVDPSMIDTVVITHSDTDTMGNLNLFPCAEVFSANRIAKENFFVQQKTPTFDGNRSDLPFHKLYDNTELYLTPGFGLQDHSLIVRNVENHGTVAIVGKLVLNETDLASSNMAIREFAADDGEQRKLWQATRREIVCLADYIIPGHGMPFKVSGELKHLAECQGSKAGEGNSHASTSSLTTSTTTMISPMEEKPRKWKASRVRHSQSQD